MDNLEEHIRKHREELDKHTPSSDLWKAIDRKLGRRKTRSVKWISIAAMITVILGTALVILQLSYTRNQSVLESINDAGTNTENTPLNETELYYNTLVNSLYREATPMLTGNPDVKRELTNDILRLDSICIEIKKDLKDNVANQEVVEALIQNYRIKIRLLEDMLVILKENDGKTEKNKSHEL